MQPVSQDHTSQMYNNGQAYNQMPYTHHTDTQGGVSESDRESDDESLDSKISRLGEIIQKGQHVANGLEGKVSMSQRDQLILINEQTLQLTNTIMQFLQPKKSQAPSQFSQASHGYSQVSKEESDGKEDALSQETIQRLLAEDAKKAQKMKDLNLKESPYPSEVHLYHHHSFASMASQDTASANYDYYGGGVPQSQAVAQQGPPKLVRMPDLTLNALYQRGFGLFANAHVAGKNIAKITGFRVEGSNQRFISLCKKGQSAHLYDVSDKASSGTKIQTNTPAQYLKARFDCPPGRLYLKA